MKKIIALCLVGILCVGLTACGTSNETSDVPNNTSQIQQEASTTKNEIIGSITTTTSITQDRNTTATVKNTTSTTRKPDFATTTTAKKTTTTTTKKVTTTTTATQINSKKAFYENIFKTKDFDYAGKCVQATSNYAGMEIKSALNGDMMWSMTIDDTNKLSLYFIGDKVYVYQEENGKGEWYYMTQEEAEGIVTTNDEWFESIENATFKNVKHIKTENGKDYVTASGTMDDLESSFEIAFIENTNKIHTFTLKQELGTITMTFKDIPSLDFTPPKDAKPFE